MVPFRSTALVGLALMLGTAAAQAGAGHHGGAPVRIVPGMHAGPRHLPPVSGTVHAGGYGRPGAAVYAAQPGWRRPYGGARPAIRYGLAGPGYRTGPAIYGTGAYGGGAYGGGRYAAAGAYGAPGVGADTRWASRQARWADRGWRHHGHRYGYGYGYGYGGAAVVGAAAGYALGADAAAAGYGTGYVPGYGYSSDYAPFADNSGYAAGDVPLSVRYPAQTGGLFGSGGYALDGQIQDVGYGGPTVAGYGYGGSAGWSPALPPAGGLGVYVPGAYGPGPRVITIPSQYSGGGRQRCTCGSGD